MSAKKATRSIIFACAALFLVMSISQPVFAADKKLTDIVEGTITVTVYNENGQPVLENVKRVNNPRAVGEALVEEIRRLEEKGYVSHVTVERGDFRLDIYFTIFGWDVCIMIRW